MPATESYFPTIVGTKWKWRVTITIGDGKGALKPTVITDSSESTIAGRETVNGVDCFRIEKTDRFGNVAQTEFLSVTGDGLYRCGLNQERFVHPIKILALPADVGTNWNGKYSSGGIQVSTSSRIVGQETVTVPAGSFRAIRVEVKPDSAILTTTTWYAPGIGVVKQLVDKSIQRQKDEVELEEFIAADSAQNPREANPN